MSKDGFRFKNVWIIEASIDAVWEALIETGSWPEWWPFLEGVELISKGDLDGVGSLFRFVWKGDLPYTLSFHMLVTRVESPIIIEGKASGDIEGIGRWSLISENAYSTRVEYCLNVRATKRWMNIFAPVLRWFFNWNHNRVMEAGRVGLTSRLRELEISVLQE